MTTQFQPGDERPVETTGFAELEFETRPTQATGEWFNVWAKVRIAELEKERDEVRAEADRLWEALTDTTAYLAAAASLLRRHFDLAQAAQAYFDGWCQDEAAEDGPFITGCAVEQHAAARRLKDALGDFSAPETLHALQKLAATLNPGAGGA